MYRHDHLDVLLSLHVFTRAYWWGDAPHLLALNVWKLHLNVVW